MYFLYKNAIINLTKYEQSTTMHSKNSTGNSYSKLKPRNNDEQMIKDYYRMATRIAHKHTNNVHDFEDLLQAGLEGLLKAKTKFNPKKGVKFSTYSYYWIVAYIMAYKEKNESLLRIPHHMRQKLRDFEKGKDTKLTKEKAQEYNRYLYLYSLDSIYVDATEGTSTFGEVVGVY